MFNYCAGTGDNSAPTSRNTWGVDLNRNFSVGSLFDGYDGASTSCTSEVFAGPGEFSEPESRNEQWVQNTFPNIKFAMNIHSSGGYFMWPPGAYKTRRPRHCCRTPPRARNQYFEQTARTVLDRIKCYRGTVVLPARTGPVADVLYSAAGNSADEAYYNHGIIGYDFEIGAQRFTGAVGRHGAPARCRTRASRPTFDAEGHDEGMEFANGNYALLDSALDYQNDTTRRWSRRSARTSPPTPFDVTFNQSEAADIYYTTDGSTPTTSSTHYGPELVRGQPVADPHRRHDHPAWLAKDFKGNTPRGPRRSTSARRRGGGVGGTVPATLALSLGTPRRRSARSRRAWPRTTLATRTANVDLDRRQRDAGGLRPGDAGPGPSGQRHVLAAQAVRPRRPARRAPARLPGRQRRPGDAGDLTAPVSNDAVDGRRSSSRSAPTSAAYRELQRRR